MSKRIYLVLLFIFLMSVPSMASTAIAQSVGGTYRCWSMNVGGYGGGHCTSPALVLNADGSYTVGSESGSYSVSGDHVVLSQSKIRGPGRLQEEGNQIVFEYTYQGQDYTVTYLHSGDAPAVSGGKEKQAGAAGGGITSLDLTIDCLASGKAVDWINTATLHCDGETYDALAVQKGPSTLSVYFRTVPPGKTCSVSVSSGFDSKTVGSVAMRGSTKQSLHGQCAW